MADITVLIHLNVTISADTPEAAERLAWDYLREHDIPTDDVTVIEAN